MSLSRMKKFLCIIISLFLILLSACSAGPIGTDHTIQLKLVYAGAELDLCAPLLREYIDEDDTAKQCDFLLEHNGENYDWQNIMLAWYGNESTEYTVYIADNPSFEDAFTAETDECEYYYGMFMPGKTYYWKVSGSFAADYSAMDSFTVKELPVALYSIDHTANVRDMGGWETTDGQTVNYGLLYRGGQLNGYQTTPVSDEGKSRLRDILGIKSEIDLRTPGVDDGGQTSNYFNPEGKYIKAPFYAYTCIIPEYYKGEYPIRAYDERVPAAFKSILEFLSDESNYPVYIHCNAGADRTGTLAFILNGLLGVPYEQLTKDFEITSFSVMGNRWRGSVESNFTDGIMSDKSGEVYVAWGKTYELMMQYYSRGGTLADAIENYLITVCGVSSECIADFKEIMLG